MSDWVRVTLSSSFLRAAISFSRVLRTDSASTCFECSVTWAEYSCCSFCGHHAPAQHYVKFRDKPFAGSGALCLVLTYLTKLAFQKLVLAL